MQIFKKLFFAPLFLLMLSVSLFTALGLFSVESALSFNFLPLIYLCTYLILVSFFYVLFISFAKDIKFVAPIIILASIIPIFLFDLNLGAVLGFGTLAVLFTGYYQLTRKLKTYITFSPTLILIPSIKLITTLLILALSFGYYFSINKTIAEKGFEVPDSLIDAIIKFSMPQTDLDLVKGDKYIAQITQEQMDFLKQNPQLLQQQGIDPKLLNQFPVTTTAPKQNKAIQVPTNTESLTKSLIKAQLNKMFDPYKDFIAPILSLLFFISLQSLSSILILLLYPVVELLFYILEKSGFIKFEKEMREVRKMVV